MTIDLTFENLYLSGTAPGSAPPLSVPHGPFAGFVSFVTNACV